MVRFESPPKVNLVREDAGYPIVSEPLHHFLNLGVLPNATNRFDRFAHPLSPWWRRDASELAAQPKLGLWSKSTSKAWIDVEKGAKTAWEELSKAFLEASKEFEEIK